MRAPAARRAGGCCSTAKRIPAHPSPAQHPPRLPTPHARANTVNGAGGALPSGSHPPPSGWTIPAAWRESKGVCGAAADARDQSGGAGRDGRGGDGHRRSGSPASRAHGHHRPQTFGLARGGGALVGWTNSRSTGWSCPPPPAQRGGKGGGGGWRRGCSSRGLGALFISGYGLHVPQILGAPSRWALPRRLFATVMPQGPSSVAHVATCHQSPVTRHVPHRPTLCNLHPPVAVPWVRSPANC